MKAAEAKRHLGALTGGWPAESWTEFRAIRRDRPPVRLFVQTDMLHGKAWVPWGRAAEAEGFSVYVGVQPRKDAGGTTEDVAGYTSFVIDLDPQHVAAGLKRARRLARLGVRPSIVIRSGRPGARHIYYHLKNLVGTEEGRELAHRLCYYVGGDMVYDPPRVLRLAGTINPKSGLLARVGSAHAGRTYGIKRLTRILDELKAPIPPKRIGRLITHRHPMLPTVAGVPPSLPRRMSRRMRVAAFWRDPRQLGFDSRSSRDAAVAASMARQGWPVERIAALMERTGLAVGDKTREEGSRYAWRTAEWAIRKAGRVSL